MQNSLLCRVVTEVMNVRYENEIRDVNAPVCDTLNQRRVAFQLFQTMTQCIELVTATVNLRIAFCAIVRCCSGDS
jgi:hypothetical protein